MNLNYILEFLSHSFQNGLWIIGHQLVEYWKRFKGFDCPNATLFFGCSLKFFFDSVIYSKLIGWSAKQKRNQIPFGVIETLGIASDVQYSVACKQVTSLFENSAMEFALFLEQLDCCHLFESTAASSISTGTGHSKLSASCSCQFSRFILNQLLNFDLSKRISIKSWHYFTFK